MMPPEIYGRCQLSIENNDPATGKPYLRLTFADGLVVEITTNLGEMIGGAAGGARLRWEARKVQ